MELSVVIITFNEERNIVRCLRSVHGIADEVVVVDSGSTDRTVELARMEQARVVHRDWTQYSTQKNFADSLATHPFILSLDADEALSSELRTSLLQAKAAGFRGAYAMNRLTNYCGTWIKHGGWYPDRKVRLFPSEKAQWDGGAVHEKLVLEKDLPCTQLKGDLLHYSYYSISEHVHQADHFTSIAARSMHKRGLHAGVVKLFLSPVATFFSGYLQRGGFRDGWHGLVIARISAFATFLKYAKLRQLWREGA